MSPHSNENRCNLRPKTFDVLCCLVERAGRLVTKEEILATVWPGAKISSAGLKRYIQEIRIALGDDAQAPRFVEAVPRRGYRFLPAVTGELVSSSRFLASRQHQEYVSLHYEERETN